MPVQIRRQPPTVCHAPRDVVPNLYGTIHGLLIGDKGFISEDLKLEAAAQEIDLQTPLRKNMPEACINGLPLVTELEEVL